LAIFVAAALGLGIAPKQSAVAAPGTTCVIDPCLQLSPARGSAGTRVEISGRITERSSLWRENLQHAGTMALSREVQTPGGTCDYSVDVTHRAISMTRGGQVRGHFIVSNQQGGCRMGIGAPPKSLAGDYQLVIGCLSCGVATFHIDEATVLPFTGPTYPLRLIALGLLSTLVGLGLAVVGRRASVR
jgi:hypothetical protein